MKIVRALAAFAVLLGALCGAALAQYDTATVLGTVSDPNGAVLPGSRLTLTNRSTGVNVTRTSNQSGEYQFTGVLPGDYYLTAFSNGFSTQKTSIVVTVGARQRVDLRMRPGTTETVTVTDAVAQVETDSSENSFTVMPTEVMNLPLNGREYADLARLAPGVRGSVLENETSTSVDASYNVNGLTSTWNDFILDGLDNNSYSVNKQGYSQQAIRPVLDAVSEFEVTTDNYSAEYGRVGGAVVNASIKSGTAHFHGDAWDYIRNPAVNAVGPFPLSPGSTPGPNQNQFGGTFGGPLPLRFLARTGKTFFFADYEGLRRSQHSPLTATVPTSTQLNSLLNAAPFLDSSGHPIPIENPYTKQVYANGVIPAPIPFAQIVLKNLQNVQNVPGQTVVAASDYTSSPAATLNSDTGDIRFDWDINNSQSFFVRYSKREGNFNAPSPIPGPDYGKSNGILYQASQQVAAGYTKVLTPQSALDARIGFTWSDANQKPYGLGADNIPVEAGIPNAPSDPSVAGGLNAQAIVGFTALGRTASTPTMVNPFVINPKVNYSWLHGKHSLKFGYEYQHISQVIMNNHPQDGSDTYKGLFTEGTMKAAKLPSGAADPAYKQAWALADFAFGARSQFELSNNPIVVDNLRFHAAYAQDDWRALPNLTLNLGLRYEFMTPIWESHNNLSNFDPGTRQLILASPGSLYTRALVHPNRLNFAPRVGFSYGLNPKTVVRGGYGIGYVQFNRVAAANELADNLPFALDTAVPQFAPSAKSGAQPVCASPQTQPVGSCFVTTQQGYPNDMLTPPAAPFNLLLNVPTYIPAHNPTAYLQSFQLDIQREIARNLLFSIAYVGNVGVHELLLADLNQATPDNAAGTLALQSRRPLNGTNCCGDVSMVFDEGQSNYNSLQTKLEKRYSGGLYFINSFTWSHAIDDAAGHLEDVDGDTAYVNLYNIASDRGRSDYDQALNETLAITYDLPFGRGRRLGSGANYLLQLIAGGWQTSIISQYTSGLPTNLTYDPTIGQEVDSSDLGGYYRANVSGDPVLPAASRVKTAAYFSYLNPATVTAPTANDMPFGNASRNSALAPNYYDLDIGLHKRFPLWSEASALELRVESFNTLNRVNYQVPDGDASDSTFGRITSAYPAREMQGAIKLFF